MAATADKKVRWADDEDEFPSVTVVGPDEQGNKTVIEKYLDENDKKVEVTRVIKVKKVRETVNHAVAARKHWKKFGEAAGLKPGPDSGSTKLDDVLVVKLSIKSSAIVQEEKPAGALAALKSKEKMVVCRICKGDHFTLKCPYKDTLGALADVVPSEETDKADQKTAADEAKKPAKYIPPAQRAAQKRGESEAAGGSQTRRDENTLRVSNLSDDTRENDLNELFRPFGHITRVFILKDKNTGHSKGSAFVSFSTKEEAQKAIKVLNGYGYDNLILKVEWSSR